MSLQADRANNKKFFVLFLTGLWGLRLSREDNFTSVVTHEHHSLQPVLAVVRQLQVNIGQAAVTVKIQTCLTSQIRKNIETMLVKIGPPALNP